MLEICCAGKPKWVGSFVGQIVGTNRCLFNSISSTGDLKKKTTLVNIGLTWSTSQYLSSDGS